MRLATILRAAGRLLAPAALLGLLTGPALAEVPAQPPATPTAGAQPATTLKPALWLVSDDDTRIYLFGTIHVLAPGLEWFSGRVAEAFEESETLVTEIGDVGGQDSGGQSKQAGGSGGVEEAQAMLRKAMLPKGETLRAKLPAEDRAKLEAALAKAGVPVTAVDRLKPWYAAVVLSSMPLIKAGYRLDQGVETQLTKRARAAGKKQEALETTVRQIGLFEDLPEESQLAYLRQVLANIDSLREQTAGIVKDWGEGDAEGLAAAINTDNTDPALKAALLTKRHDAWADWIERRLEEPGTVFVAVGAGHLAGPLSLQRELAERGIESPRVQ